jgi:hypothetical protein
MNKRSKKRLLNKKNKTLKKKTDNSCDKFCKNYYSPEIEKQFKKMSKGNKLPPPTKEQLDLRIVDCKQNFCNEGCKGYKFFSKEEENKFKKNINGSFLKKTKPKIIQKLKSKGAVSNCENSIFIN